MLPTAWDRETDVAVVGGGGSGLAAALAAAERRAEVELFEKCPQLGGTTGIAVGSFTAAGTSFQRAAGIADDPASHDEDMGLFAAHREVHNNRALRRWLAENAAETLDWLIGLGLEFHGPRPEPPNRVARMHNVVPNAKALVATLQRRGLELGVRTLVRHRVRALFRQDDGPVVGLQVEGPSGPALNVRARRGVVLAAGDYVSGEGLKGEFLSAEVAAVAGINPDSTGDGHVLGRAVGARLVNMPLVYGPEIRFVPPPRPPFVQLLPANPWLARIGAWLVDRLPRAVLSRVIQGLLVTWQHPETRLLERGSILVNRDGERFCDERDRPELAIPHQPGQIAYFILDRKLAEQFSSWPHFISTAPGIAYAYLDDYRRLRPDVYAEAATVAGLAERIGVGAAALERSVGDSELGHPPFYALGPVKSWLVTSEGGLRVSERMEALGADDRPIPGLYACGSNGMGGVVLFGHGLHLAWAFTSGRAAGRNAAARTPRGEDG